MTQSLAIIGGGWSGLSAAAALCQGRPNGLQISLLEAAPQLGGRARGLAWDGLPIDNGQHLLLGAYTSTRRLLDWAGTPTEDWLSKGLEWVHQPMDRPAFGFQIPSAGWPVRLLAGALAPTTKGCQAWPWPGRLGLMRLLWSAHRANWQASGTAHDWLIGCGPLHGVEQQFCRPFIEGALNTDWTEASAAVFLRVLQDTLAGGARATDAMHPPDNLSDAAIDPLAAQLVAHGVRIRLGCRARRLRAGHDGRWHVEADANGPHEAFNHVLVCLPTRETERLWQASAMPETDESKRWRPVETRGIATLWLALPERPARGWLPSHRLLAIETPQGATIMGLARPAGPWGQVVGLVASAVSPTEGWDAASVSLWEAARRWLAPLGLGEPLQWRHRITHERHATWACTAGLVDAGLAWGSSKPLGSGLWRAADDLCPGYPATIESAVRAGQQVARSILEDRHQRV